VHQTFNWQIACEARDPQKGLAILLSLDLAPLLSMLDTGCFQEKKIKHDPISEIPLVSKPN